MACHPVIRALRAGLAAGRFGTPRQLHADLGFVVEPRPTDRMFDPALGGGALLDMGIYPLTFAHLMLGPADSIAASAPRDRGIDLDSPSRPAHGEAVSALTASMTSVVPPHRHPRDRPTGRLDLPASFHAPAYATWTPSDGEPERIEVFQPLIGTGLGSEAAHAQDCLHVGPPRESAGPARPDPDPDPPDGRDPSADRGQLCVGPGWLGSPDPESRATRRHAWLVTTRCGGACPGKPDPSHCPAAVRCR